MRKHFNMKDDDSVYIIFMENGIVEDIAVITIETVEQGEAITTESGKEYTLTADDYRGIITEQMMYLMRTEQFTPQHIKRFE